MKLVKSLLLGSAAGLVAVAGAQAADLPTKKAAPVEYVRICSVYGPGFFYIPGTDTCLRISGRAAFEYEYDEPRGHGDSTVGENAVGRIRLDARTATDFGLLRSYVEFEGRRRSGAWYGSGTATRMAYTETFQGTVGPFPSYSGNDTAGNKLETTFNLRRAFVQWGGLTAGRVQSFFDFYADNDNYHGMNDSDVTTTALAYTYTFGSGFSATLAAEDGIERRNPIAGVGTVAGGNIFPSVFTGAAYSNFALSYPTVLNPIAAAGASIGTVNTSQRESVPDVVGALRVDQAWGSAQLSGAWHHVSTSGSGVTVTGLTVPGVSTINTSSSGTGGYLGKSAEGYAIQGGVKINLPMIAAGDTFWLEGGYSKGAITYTSSGYQSQETGVDFAFGSSYLSSYDGVMTPSGQLKLTSSYSVMADFLHYWTPTIRQAFFGSYFRESYGSGIKTAAGYAYGAATGTAVVGTVTLPGGKLYNPFSPYYLDGAQWQVGSNITWSPVKDLDIGLEVIYVRNEDGHKHFDVNRGYPYLSSGDGQFLGRMKIQRDF